MICVYTIHHPFTGMFYIGCTQNFIKRRIAHTSQLRRGSHVNQMLQYNFNLDRKLDWTAQEIDTIEEARAIEKQMIHAQLDNPLLMNQQGRPLSEEWCKAISESWTPERRAIVDNYWDATRREERAALTASAWTDDRREKHSKRLSDRMTGFRHSAESKAKLVLVHTGKPLSDAHKESIRNSRKGIKISINGTIYAHFGEAHRALKIHKDVLRRRVKSTNSKWSAWYIVPPE